MNKRLLSGIQPSGRPHLGNYFGMMKKAIDYQDRFESLLFIADYHALTTNPDPALLRQRSVDLALDFMACGLDLDRTIFFRQSDVPQVTELSWILATYTPMGLLERCHSFKDKVAHGIVPNAGLFTYPVLMAADILLYNSSVVPVGKDQKQHLEVARDLAIRFNNAHGDIFVLPEPMIEDQSAVIPGLDGQKMSKSYNNTIELFGEEKATRKKFMSIQTDSKGLEEPKDPDTCSIFALYKLFASPDACADLAAKYRAGNYGYGHAKQLLFETFWEYMRPFREKRAELAADLPGVEQRLQRNGERAREIAEKTMSRIRHAIGLR